jgi:Quinohemoprotein amine dehydrogenase, gamma subunit
MKHLSPLNDKARRLAQALESPASPGPAPASQARDVVALEQLPQQPQGPHIPLGCSTLFAPGWEVDRTGGTAGLCQPVERDLFDCHLGCFWPAQVPDQLNHAPDWTKKCAAAQKDWRQIDIIFP